MGRGMNPSSLRFARNGYEASALVQDFRPEIAIIDMEGLPDQGFGLLDSIAADPRVPHIRVILAIPPEVHGEDAPAPPAPFGGEHAGEAQVCDQIEEVVRGSMVELSPKAENQTGLNRERRADQGQPGPPGLLRYKRSPGHREWWPGLFLFLERSDSSAEPRTFLINRLVHLPLDEGLLHVHHGVHDKLDQARRR